MRVETAKIVVAANGKGTYEITDQLASAVTNAVQTRALAVFVRHTRSSLIMMETPTRLRAATASVASATTPLEALSSVRLRVRIEPARPDQNAVFAFSNDGASRSLAFHPAHVASAGGSTITE